MDVAVVGAGPAGSFCAWRLARAGHRVTLYDPSHPREKPCGGGVTPGVFARWPELGELRAAARPSHLVRLAGPRGRELSVGLAQPIEIFSRRVLDSLLLERACKAGAELRELRVRRVGQTPGGIELELAGGARARHGFVVGADGAASAVRRSLLGERPGGAASYATAGFHVAGLAESEIAIEFTREFAGYLWVFPRTDHASVGIAAPVGAANGTELRARVLEFLERRYPGSRALPSEPYAASIPVAPGPVAGPGFALAGDAANANDAITGEGIGHALDSGGLVADALCEAGPERAPALYTERWQAGPGGELAACARLARRLYRPATVDFSLALAAHSRRARRLMADMLVAGQSYRALGRRLARDLLRPRSATA
ncbi:MAG TPA: NAD(P)/FAD-dependent oxidoreductase [Myxococcota bacterium]|nr:NAD(P)/FAD-dependent oxidoreductase [Myxococcota bacterium]